MSKQDTKDLIKDILNVSTSFSSGNIIEKIGQLADFYEKEHAGLDYNWANKDFKVRDKIVLCQDSDNFNLSQNVTYEVLAIPSKRDGIMIIKDNNSHDVEVNYKLFTLQERPIELNIDGKKVNI